MGAFTVYIDEVPEFELKNGTVYVRSVSESVPDIAMPLDIYLAISVESEKFRQSLAKRRTEPTPFWGRRSKG